MPTVPLDIPAPPAAPQHAPRRGADRCPTAVALHPAADGLIARVRLPGGRLSVAGARVVERLARETASAEGSAVAGDRIELTVRGNLQVRGLRAEHAGPLAAALHAAGLLPSAEHDQARTIIASPLAGRLSGTTTVDGLIAAIDHAICDAPELTALSGRFLTAVDDGSGMVDVTAADLALAVSAPPGGLSAGFVVDGPMAELLVGGVSVGLVPVADAPQVLVAAARAFVTRSAGTAWRVRELADGGAAIREALRETGSVRSGRVAVARRGGPAGSSRALAPLPPLGPVRQADGRFALRVATVLGRLDAAQLDALAGVAELAGTDLRLAGDRTVTLVDLPERLIMPSVVALRACGLVVDPADSSLGLTACAGLGCATSAGDVRAAARLRLLTRPPGAPDEHVVGCERRCGAREAATTFVATQDEFPEALAERIRLAALETHR